jgi:lipid-A-disaccharide synthase
VWAWRPERAKKVAALYDGILCLLPFEPAYFEREGMKAVFIGHAVMESGLPHANAAAFRVHHNIPANAPVMGLLFGSRMGEINRMGPVLRAAARVAAKDDPTLHIVSPTLPHLKREVRNLLQKMPCAVHITDDAAEKYEAFRAMDFALATSGTVGLELAVADTPHIIAYRMSPLTWRMIRNKLRVKYAHLVNILLDRPVVPEFIQQNCQADAMGAELLALAQDGGIAQQQCKEFARVREMIAGPDEAGPSQAAARFILDLVK